MLKDIAIELIYLIAQAIDLIINHFGLALIIFTNIATLILFWPLGLALLGLNLYHLYTHYNEARILQRTIDHFSH